MAGTDTKAEEMASAAERRLARLRFDLHDGPQQDVHLLALDLNLFREQLVPIIAENPNRDRLIGRLDDLSAQLEALDGSLRRLSRSVESPFMHAGSLADGLRQITDAFARRAGVEPDVRLAGDFSALSDSQRIALTALVREALSNVRAHSQATRVSIDISSHERGVDARVTDDGVGFDPERTIVKAARDGHLGLVGMHERVRMLGGRTEISSRPGGPTVVSASLPAWPPRAGAP
jgi:two-component system, NarL family, sensor histidine kinase DegS